jgi:hypothetical protein
MTNIRTGSFYCYYELNYEIPEYLEENCYGRQGVSLMANKKKKKEEKRREEKRREEKRREEKRREETEGGREGGREGEKEKCPW